MKSSKKALAFALAAAMAITGVPVTNAGAATTTAKLGATKATIYAGSSKYISVSTPSSWKSVKLSVSSSKTSVASVKKNNAKKKIRVDAVKAGTAKVTVKVTAKKSGKTVKKTLSANITVKDYKVRLVDAAGTTVSNTTIDTTVGTAVKLTAKTAPANDKVTFTSDNESVATVDASGNVTPVKAGTAVITAKTDKASDKVTIVVADKLTDGVTATLVNPFSSDYPDTVLVSEKAVINVKAVKDGKPVVGETVIFNYAGANDTNIENSYGPENTSAVTNANGVATFVFGYKNNPKPESSDTRKMAAFNYTATVAATGDKVEKSITFAAVTFGSVNNVNNDPKTSRPADVNSLTVSENDKVTVGDTTFKGNGTTWTAGTQTNLGGNTGLWTEYVDSQQVSVTGGKEHQVQFNNFLPYIWIPGLTTATSEAKEFTQDINYTSGEYHIYAQNDSAYTKVVELEKDPREVTWAHLNFSSLQLSKYTKLVIKTYSSAYNLEKDNPVDTYVLEGQREQTNFSYQIPLKSDYSKLYIKTTLKSYGQVDDDKNGGFTIKDITGVYKTQTQDNGKQFPLENAKVTWETVTAPMSQIEYLNADDKTKLGLEAGKTVSYQVPVFPYTGNAVLTQYDANGNVDAYYVCPTVNNGKNVNVLDFNADYCYKVSKEEALNQVGTITSQTNDTVTVNSEKSGVTTLVGKLTDLEGKPLAGFDAANDKVYTSVQWSPLPNTTTTSSVKDGFLALTGQTVDVIAQLTDVNGNAVSTKDVGVEFDRNGVKIVEKNSYNNAVAVKVAGVTDANGQAKLTLQAAQVALLDGLTAKSDDSKFNVVLKVADQVTKEADIYWVDADLKFVDQEANDVDGRRVTTSKARPYVSTSDNDYAGIVDIKATVGTNWEYGMYTGSDKIKAGVFKDKTPVIKNLKINLTKTGEGSINTETGVNGMAKATSTKTGTSKIVGKLNAASITNDVTFIVDGKEIKSAGTGATNLDKQLTIEVTWLPAGLTTEIKTPNGSKVVLAGAATQAVTYVSVTDIYGNAYKNGDAKPVTLSTNGTAKFVDKNGNLVETLTVTPTTGIAKIIVKPNVTNQATSTIISATVDTKTVTKIIDWVISEGTAFTKAADSTPALDNGKITIKFTDNIVNTSVTAGQFTVKIDGIDYAVSSAVAEGNTVTLTVKNGPTTIRKGAPIIVNIDSYTDSNDIEYTMTSEHGVAYTAGPINWNN